MRLWITKKCGRSIFRIIVLALLCLALLRANTLTLAQVSQRKEADTISYSKASAAITAVAIRPDGRQFVVGSFRSLSAFDQKSPSRSSRFTGITGAVSALAYSLDGRLVFAGGGLAGRTGEIDVLSAGSGKLLVRLTGPEDLVQSIDVSPDGKLIAGGSYDRSVYLWKLPTNPGGTSTPVPFFKRLKDHTDAVYSVAFSPDGHRLASAAGDRTVKVWDVAAGKRLFTLTESTAELYSVAYRPHTAQIVASGADRVIRVWDSQTGDFIRSGFAHDGAVLRLAYTHDGKSLISSGEDRAVKRWNADTLEETAVLPGQSDWPQALAVSSDDMRVLVGCHDGSLHSYSISPSHSASVSARNSARLPAISDDSTGLIEQYCTSSGNVICSDPPTNAPTANDSFNRAQHLDTPGMVSGELWDGKLPAGSLVSPLNHYYRFHAVKSQPLAIIVNARRTGSPLDSYIEVLDSVGKPVEQAILRSIGQSEITLFDKDSAITGIRLLPFPGLELNDYVMIGRELLRVGTLPKGPDDDTQFRSIHGQRVGYLGTNPEYHSIGTKVFRVQVHSAGSRFSPNGMPLVHLMYQNDDGGPLYGRDSYLEFRAPYDGDYIVRLTDARGQQGKGFVYKLELRSPRPDYKISFNPAVVSVPKGGAVTVGVDCDRYEGFDGPIHVKLTGLPPGFSCTETDIEASETSANLIVTADGTAVGSTDKVAATYRVVAEANILGATVSRFVEPDPTRKLVVGAMAGVAAQSDTTTVALRPGAQATIVATITRSKGFSGRVPLEIRNLPFGVKVLDVGLNGILVNENETTRRIVIACEPWVKPQERQICLYAGVEGGIGTGAPAIKLVITR